MVCALTPAARNHDSNTLSGFQSTGKNPRNKFKSFESIQTSHKMVFAQTPALRKHTSNTPFGFSNLGVKILDPTLKAMKAYKLAQ
jgi:hypothetical protein